MKSTLLSLVVAMIIPAVSSAKVEDFNAMINENSQAQSQLQTDLKEQMGLTRQAQKTAPRKVMIEVASDHGSNSINSPTKKSMLTFDKETVHYRGSEAKQNQRTASEIKSAGEQF
jgi:hypothetical protein